MAKWFKSSIGNILLDLDSLIACIPETIDKNIPGTPFPKYVIWIFFDNREGSVSYNFETLEQRSFFLREIEAALHLKK